MTELIASVDKQTGAHLAIAGEGGVVKQEVGTKEEDNSIKYTQACPVQENRPAQEGVFCYVSERKTVLVQHSNLIFLLAENLGVKK